MRGCWGLGLKGEGIKPKKSIETDNSRAIARGEEGGGDRRRKRGINGDGRRLDLG